jgi:Flp pilus assembly pilin Flp
MYLARYIIPNSNFMEEKRMYKLSTKLNSMLQSLKKDERGQDMVEYVIMTGMIAVAAITSIQAVAAWVVLQWTTLQGALGA